MNQALKGFFERTAKYLGDLVGGEPEPVKSSRRKSPSKRTRRSKPEGIVATTVVVGDVK